MQAIRAVLLGLGLLMVHVPAYAQTGLSDSRSGSGTAPSELAVASSMLPVPRPENLARNSPSGMQAQASSALPEPRPERPQSGHAMRMALVAAQDEDWEKASTIARSVSDAAADIIEWQRLRAGDAVFSDYLRFLDRNGDWPGLKRLRRVGEASIPDNAPPRDVIRYFHPQPPQTGHGALRLSEAYARTGERDRARAQLVQAWKSLKMTETEEAAILESHAATVRPHHEERLSHALWQEDIAFAERMLPRVGARSRTLARARLALQRQAHNAVELVRALPDKLASDPGLARDRMEWQIALERPDAAARIMLDSSRSRASLGRPEAWADRRRKLARQEMRDGNGRRAYRLASSHHLDSGSHYADLEWLSGYLALRFLNEPAKALEHFRNFRGVASTAISLGKAGYWEGRALEAAGNAEAAETAYRETAQRYQTSFYGLLAAEKAGVPMDPDLAGHSGGVSWQGRAFLNSTVLKAALLLRHADQAWEPSWFLRHLAESMGPDDLNALVSFAVSLDDPYIAVRVGKQAASQGVTVQNALYPLLGLKPERLRAPQALVLAIARQESEFYPAAVSPAGARGIMQVMPATAREMASEIGLSYSGQKLTDDPAYSAVLGSAYLEYLFGELGRGAALVAAGYNAGPRRAQRWAMEYGNPRDRQVNIVDWIEHIPFRETRNYVMRVAESVIVYRARLAGGPVSIELSELLKGR